MSKLNRVLWSGLVLVGAACGDDVTVAPPPPPPEPGVRAVTVAPDGATIAVGASLTFTAAVTTDPGAAAPTIAWSSSNNAIATVSAAGVATGVAVGSVGIRATATSGTSSASGVATLNVSTTSVTPATVSIQSIEQGGVPQNLNDLDGQVDVRVNLERGGESVQTVQLLIDGAVVVEQVFGSAVQGSAPETAIEELVFSWNTAAYDPITGIAKHLNGPHAVAAKVITSQNAQGTGSPNVNVVLDNSNTAIVTIEIANGADATDSNGELWYTGDARVTALPVIYTTTAPLIAQVVFNPDGALNSVVDTEAPYSAVWAKGTTFANGGSGGNGNPGIEDDDFEVCVSATVNGTASGTLLCTDFIRYDNNGPGAPTFIANPNGRASGWINGTVGLVGSNTSATDNDWLSNGAADLGVGGYTRMLQVGTGGGTVANALTTAASATPTLPAPSANNLPTAYCAVASAADDLGNVSAALASTTPCLVAPAGPGASATGSQHLQFGVDIYAPTAKYDVTSLANGDRLNGGSVGGEFVVTVNDTGSVGNSGMLAGSPVISNVIRRTAAGTVLPADCVQGTVVTAVCTQSNVNLNVAFPLISTIITGETTAGYYSHTAKALDAAGNSTDIPAGAVVVYDATPATATTPAVPVTITGPFSAAAFLNDNLSIRDYYYTIGYSGGLFAPAVIPLAAAPTVVDAFNAATLTNINYAVNTVVNTYLGLQATDGANTPQAYVAGAAVLNALNLFVRDQAQAAYTAATPAAIAPTPPATGFALSSVSPLWNFNSFVPALSNALICAGQTGAPACGATPNSTVVSATANGTTGTFPAPFTRVNFYAANALGTELILIGSATTPSTNDNGAVRSHSYAITVTAAGLYAALGGGPVPAVLGPVNVYAFGVNANGTVALVSQAVALTVNP